MHFILTPVGSSGDVHPFVGIGRRLRERGHEVTLLSAETFRDLCERADLAFESGMAAAEFEQTLRNPDLWHPTRGPALVFRTMCARMRDAYARLERLYRPGRSVLVGHGLSVATRVFEEVHGAPAATLHLSPCIFRSQFRGPALGPFDISGLPRPVKAAIWRLIDRFLVDPLAAPELNRWRAELGLPPVRRVFESWLHSPRRVIGLFPDWFGDPQPDWPVQSRVTGFPLFDEADGMPLDPSLQAFLDAGQPPIAFTPGTANRHASRFLQTAIEATAWIGRRALLLTRYRDHLPADLPPHVRHVPYLPFSEVLPRCAAIVHHGGIGTVAQALAAGIPQLVMPMAYDQPDNAMRVKRLGAGSWLAPARFIPPKVAPALRGLLGNPEVAAACGRYRRSIREANPVDATCDLLEEVGADARPARAASGGRT